MLTFQSSHLEAGWSHDKIKEVLAKLKLQYWAICDEIGGGTDRLHTHLILYRPTAMRSSTLNKLFPSVHQDILKGTLLEARSYLLKEGKWASTDKAETVVEGTFEEWGELPAERGQGHRSDLEKMMNMVKENYTDLEIIEAIPSLVDKLTSIQRYRQLLIEESAHEFRKMTVIYCYGKTGAGKTRSVYEQFANERNSIYTINDYRGNGIFDGYDSARVKCLCLDEFRSQLPFGFLLALTDGQFQVINCRYSNKIAVHTSVYIISNISLLEQYPNIQREEPESWKAFLRRIQTVRYYYDIGKYHDYTVEEYLKTEKNGSLTPWEKIDLIDTPFNTLSNNQDEDGEQMNLPFL